MITSNILQRTFHIFCAEGDATAFAIDVGNRQYLVTARHVAKDISATQPFKIYYNGDWEICELNDIWLSDEDLDLALLSPVNQIAPPHPVKLGGAEYFLSQDIYFVGFPYGLRLDQKDNRGFPIPLVKKGIVAGFTFDAERSSTIYCDAINNKGFSGGPLITIDNHHQPTIIGVISSFLDEEKRVLLNGKETDMTYSTNSGIVIAHNLKSLLDAVASRKSGAHIKGLD